MTALNIDPDYLRFLILKVRAIMAKEEQVTPDSGSNPTDDEIPATLQESLDDLSREELVEELQGLAPEQKIDLVALLWLGRGDAEPEEWSALIKQAQERQEIPAEEYLLGYPLLADHWADALDMLEQKDERINGS